MRSQGINADLLKGKLLSRLVTTGGFGRRSSEYHVPLNVEQARNSRDALAKSLYYRMFDWIVESVNVALGKLSSVDNNPLCLGVLDIFGFEVSNAFIPCIILNGRFSIKMDFSNFASITSTNVYSKSLSSLLLNPSKKST